MKVKFNKFERVAGLFVGIAFLGGILSLGAIAIKQSWFERKIKYYTEIEKAEGIFPGTKVKMAGLKAGRVEEVILLEDKVLVKLSVLNSFSSRIKTDSMIVMSRPFIIGEKIIDISAGSKDAEILKPNSKIPTNVSFDLTDLLDPRVLQPHFESFTRFAENLKYLADAFSEKERSMGLVQMFDDLRPLLKNANVAAIEVQKISEQLLINDNLGTVMSNVALTTTEFNKEIDNLMQMSRELPQITENSAEVMKNLATLTKHMNKLIPTITEVAPELPKASRRAIEAMDEAVIVLKAFQKSFVLKSAVADVRKEEEERRKKQNKENALDESSERYPANFKSGEINEYGD